MSTEENKANVRRWTEEGWNQRNWAVFDELAASNWVFHDPGLPNVRTLADYKRWASETQTAFPDNHVTIEDMIAEGDKVVVRQTFHGTNTGEIVTPMPLPRLGSRSWGRESPSSVLLEGRESKSGARWICWASCNKLELYLRWDR